MRTYYRDINGRFAVLHSGYNEMYRLSVHTSHGDDVVDRDYGTAKEAKIALKNYGRSWKIVSYVYQ